MHSTATRYTKIESELSSTLLHAKSDYQESIKHYETSMTI